MVGDEAAGGPPRVLLVEDDDALRRSLVAVLEENGYRVSAVADGDDALGQAQVFRPDIAVLDVRLGPTDGFAIAAALRADPGIPFVFVTAADALDDRLRGFDLGADDYLVKPFEVAELLARLRAVLRRSGRLRSPVIEIRDVVIDEVARRVVRNGLPIRLTPIEFDVLLVLASHPNRVFSKRQLLVLVWGFGDLDPNVVEVHVSALRRKLDAAGPRLIETERAAGYVIRG